MANSNPTISVKLVLLGESAVGKSCIVQQYVKSTYYDSSEATIGAAFLTQMVVIDNPPRSIKFEIWDTAGQERYRSLAPMYYRGAQAAIVAYSIADKNSFVTACSWVDELRKATDSSVIIALAGNKVDLVDEREVSTNDGKTYADSNNLLFLETSAKTNHNIQELFNQIAERIPVKDLRGHENSQGAVLTAGGPNSNNLTSSCCK